MFSDNCEIEIDGRLIGPSHPPYVIAEVSANHNGDLTRALAIIQAAVDAGVSAIKIQTLRPDFITINHDGPGFIVQGGLWHGRKLFDLYQEAQTPWDWHKPIFDFCKELGVTAFSSPFDTQAVDFLAKLNVPAFKIASFELPDIPLIKHVAKYGKPMIMSTGMGSLGDIELAVDALRECRTNNLALLHCVSAYPADPQQANLRTIGHLRSTFNVPVGLSDHTLSNAVSVAAIAQGACIIEKHFTLSRDDGGLDSAFSLEPNEMKRLVSECNMAWEALGHVNYALEEGELGSKVFRRSIYAVDDIRQGEALTDQNIRSIRPGFGLPPKYLDQILGKTARVDIKRGTPLDWKLIN